MITGISPRGSKKVILGISLFDFLFLNIVSGQIEEEKKT